MIFLVLLIVWTIFSPCLIGCFHYVSHPRRLLYKLGFHETAKRLAAADRKKHQQRAQILREKTQEKRRKERDLLRESRTQTRRNETRTPEREVDPEEELIDEDDLEDDGFIDEDDEELMRSSIAERWGLIAQRIVKAHIAAKKAPERREPRWRQLSFHHPK